LKVLFVLHYPPPVHGAAAVGDIIKSSNLINESFKTKYINLSTSKSIDDIGSKNPVKILRYINIVFSTLNKLLFWKPNLVYLTISSRGGGLIKDVPLVFLCRLFRKKHVFHFHNKGVRLYAQKHKWADRLYNWLFKKAKVILLSPHLYDDIANYVDKKDVFYCANGIHNNEAPFKTTRERKDVISLLFLSNLIRSKGIFDLLSACEKLKDEGVQFSCSIIGGEGDLTVHELQAEIKHRGISQQVKYVGKKYGTEKNDYFENADIFVHPTHEDCFPLVLLEAMSFGLPILSTNEGAIPEIVDDGKNGMIVSKGNKDALVASVKSYAENPQSLVEHGENAREKFRKHYTIDQFEQRLNTIFIKMVKTD
jgi:glycosyltransferase involved in cell wall biosynthesis